MAKILHTADWHLGKRLQEFSRIEEQKHVLEEIVEIADRENVDLVLLAGDVYDTYNPTHEAVDLFYKTLRKLSKGGARPVIVISGNHDSTQFIEAPDPLARQMGILFYSKHDTIVPVGELNENLFISRSKPGFIEITGNRFSDPVRIILAPYANEVLLKTYLGEGDREASFRDLMAAKWKILAEAYCDSAGINLFLGHFFFMNEGAKPEPEPESERPILHVGGTQALFTHLLPSQLQYAALGHLHRYHAVSQTPCPVVYASSPLSYSFSEADQQKQVVIIEATAGKPVSYRPIPLTKGKPLHRKTFENLEKAVGWLQAHPDTYVELTYATEYAIDAATRKALLGAHDGIVNLIPLIRSGGEGQNTGLQVEDLEKDMVTLFNMYYHSEKGHEPNPETVELFREIIGQNHEA
ncbi:MAG: exonuclease SbcCD subunit D [Lunatimonas sp.]|uniref:metallophosphoesterase family protein n=1 Tax=Lunatimonas sp. TaxID=2060141 RepID=UPI00263B19C8|nr:exonuclease SbcCD subunit D [Lunatimonas sp.]MCC5939667.1 exonuclease SbcCD subunit D [Lunatimonas sp.]